MHNCPPFILLRFSLVKILFHHVNARPHVERRVIESIANKGCKLLPHPPYSPIEASTNYHVNRLLKKLVNKIYKDFDNLADVNAWNAPKNRKFFARRIEFLPSKLETVIKVEGEYPSE